MQLLRNNGIEPEVVEYLKYPLSVNELKSIAQMLGLRPKDFIRKGEQDFKTLDLKEKLEDDEVLFSGKKPCGIVLGTIWLFRYDTRLKRT